MSWLDNLLGAFWIVLQILLWVGAIALVGLIIAAVISGVWDQLMKRKEPARDTLRGAAEAAAISRYRSEHNISDKVDGFVAGADYMWDKLHPKKK